MLMVSVVHSEEAAIMLEMLQKRESLGPKLTTLRRGFSHLLPK